MPGPRASGPAVALLLLEKLRTQHPHITAHARRQIDDANEDYATAKQAEHTTFTVTMTSRLAEKDQTIRELDGTVRLAERRADIAEERVQREAKRANEAQARLSDLLDDVLAAREEMDESGEAALQDLPTIVDLLAWEDRVSEATTVEELRKQA